MTKSPLKIGLLILGLIIIGIGFSFVFLVDNDYEGIDTSKFNISSEPKELPVERCWTEEDFIPEENKTTNIENLCITFTAEDIFSVGYPFTFDVNLDVKNSERLSNIYISFPPPGGTQHDPNFDARSYIDKHLKSKSIVPLDNFGKKWIATGEIQFDYQNEISYLILIESMNGSYELIRNPSKLITVEPFFAKIQTELARITMAQVEQTNEDISNQRKNNAITTGLTLILLGWVPIAFAIQRKS